ncbi:MAG: type VI secretion system ATPase TssH [Xanthomonadales bacterium]|nr:type VI secretion system ATPase TssH [Xanthomonadales bacterium]
MTEISRTALFGKLNSLLYQSIESATVFCKMRANPYVEVIHWLQQILQLQDSDLHKIVNHFDIEIAHLASDFTRSLDRLPRGASSVSDLSSHLEESVERAWVYGSLMFQSPQIRSGYLLIGILKSRSLRNELLNISKQFDKIKIDTLAAEFDKITSGSPEDHLTATDGSDLSSAESALGQPGRTQGKGDALAKFTVDLTEQARSGELDPIVGRDEEIRQIIDILMRRRQNNPILTGEAGVGKTAVVEGFAMRLASGDVPPQLKNVALKVLDLGLLQAGAGMKGEFEQRLRQIIDDVQASEIPIILFIDEAHTLIGAGGAEGTGDAANLLKPALARGTLRTVAATTFAEYKKYIEKDPALTRRFQVVQVGEPSEDKCIQMLRCISPVMERHHKVQVFDEAVQSATRLSHRYIPARQLPDKAVSLLDTACARVAVALHSTPAPLEDCDHRIIGLELEQEILEREKAIGHADNDRAAKIIEELTVERERQQRLTQRWETEKTLVDEILALRRQLIKADEEDPEDVAKDEVGTEIDDATLSDEVSMRQRLAELQDELTQLQGEQPLVFHSVDGAAVAMVVEDWTGIPVGSMVKNEVESILNMTAELCKRVIGQDHGLEMIVSRVQTSRARLDNPGKPIGVFMLCGPSGVGKTETALALAESLYGGEQNLITINMSEFQEAHTVSTLKGAPPGYVGYGEGGVLTEAVRRRPYSVVLLDEIEKAHPDVHEIFFQVFDKGVMEDGEGRMIDFRNTLILLTSNVGSELIMNFAKDPELMPDAEGIAKALREPQLQIFPAALLGRIVSIPYYPLSDEVLHKIIILQLNRIRKRMAENHDIPFTYTQAALTLISNRCTELESGGRMIDAILTNTVLPQISRELLTRMAAGEALNSVEIDAADDDFKYIYS